MGLLNTSLSTSPRASADSTLPRAPITISDLPVLSVMDLTKRSANMRKYKQGSGVRGPQDLETEIVVDTKIDTGDLHKLEKEVNKHAEKKHQAMMND